ncbi:OpgC domain-containing protein [Bradyrhizobium sp. WYCCWR 13023]|uniref:OpgC domain-containing protein n=1 Tax=Bradyrhizobium zhengyangense TaxID=2911009 RepID=A0A9X1RJ55_9BRAD|nr:MULTISPECIES: OpgC domain-containing protein [Bradyrhizobium]MCG2632277.1 OpgC domain-containing protein [Bradyrhizobium zhengyangense]MCG2644033.1 OpgC domain-containing protein [Bradyrhizobium zhengyangense]MCG2668664.1 OpgC domain-containing protein [Bradyrhizobium zhengyangense]
MAKESTDLFVVERDLRLDLLRGLGLWMIFLDHIPDDVVAWLTLRNYGFSDAAEFFVFISGYLLGFIYVPIVAAGQFLPALKRLWLRAWQMYVAHILLFLAFTAQIARAARKWDNPMYKDEFNVANFLAHPDELIGKALTLQYKPVDLDVLPLYISLVLVSPFVVWCLVRRPNLTLAGSIVLYLLARYFDWNLPSYPKGATWYFNPFAWQLMFFFGAWCGCGAVAQISKFIQSRIVFAVAIGWIAFALVIVMTWHSAFLESLIPKWMIKLIYPIDKTDLDMLRFTHFLALAVIVSRYLNPDWEGLKSKWLRPLVLCGQHSLPLFCLGVFLSFGVHWMLVQWKHQVVEQILLSIGGMVIMTAVAWLLDRAQRVRNLFVDAGGDERLATKLQQEVAPVARTQPSAA